jgi:hypothetical protein
LNRGKSRRDLGERSALTGLIAGGRLLRCGYGCKNQQNTEHEQKNLAAKFEFRCARLHSTTPGELKEILTSSLAQQRSFRTRDLRACGLVFHSFFRSCD